jgi:type IV pilus assembly protein PilW
MVESSCLSQHSLCRTAGFTVTELLVAMVVTLLLSAGLIQVFLGVRHTFAVNEALARLQEDGRFAIQHLAAIASIAGHDDPDTPDAIAGAGLRADLGAGSVSLTVRFEGGTASDGSASIFDCLGMPVTSGEIASNVFSLNGKELQCESTIDGAAPLSEVLVGNVDAWRVLYGVDDDADQDTAPNRYLPGGAVSAAQWPSVCVLRLGLVVASSEEVAADNDNRVYRLLDQSFAAPGDRRLRDTFTATVLLRNGVCQGISGS